MKVALLAPVYSGPSVRPWAHFGLCGPLLALLHLNAQNGTVVPAFSQLESIPDLELRAFDTHDTVSGAIEAYREAASWGARVLLGPRDTLPAIAIGYLSALDRIPVLGWQTKSPELANRDEALGYPYFSRVDPSVATQANSVFAALFGLNVKTYVVLYDSEASGAEFMLSSLSEAERLSAHHTPALVGSYDLVRYREHGIGWVDVLMAAIAASSQTVVLSLLSSELDAEFLAAARAAGLLSSNHLWVHSFQDYACAASLVDAEGGGVVRSFDMRDGAPCHPAFFAADNPVAQVGLLLNAPYSAAGYRGLRGAWRGGEAERACAANDLSPSYVPAPLLFASDPWMAEGGYAYDAMAALALGVSALGPNASAATPEAILAALRAVAPFEGASGTVAFDATGERANGTRVTVSVLQAAAGTATAAHGHFVPVVAIAGSAALLVGADGGLAAAPDQRAGWLLNASGGAWAELPLGRRLCNPGWYYDTALLACTPCSDGRFSDSATHTACDACPAGSFAQSGWSRCDACVSGKYAPVEGSFECLTCDPGKSSGAAAASCEACEAGTASPNGAPCHECAAGTFSAGGALGCSACEAGTYSTRGAAACSVCGDYFKEEHTAETAEDFGDEMPLGINCSGGVARGVLPGYWAEWPLSDAVPPNGTELVGVGQPTNSTRVFECEEDGACLGGWNSTCREGHFGYLCASCFPGWYIARRDLCEMRANQQEPGLGRSALVVTGLMSMCAVVAALAVACAWCTTRPKKGPPRPPWERGGAAADDDGVEGGAKEGGGAAVGSLVARQTGRYSVWVHREVDELAPFAFGKHLASELRRFGVEARYEDEPYTKLEGAQVCVFQLSDRFFEDERSLTLMRLACELKKQCVTVNMPGTKYGNDPQDPQPFPENAFNPAFEPFCPELKPAFAEICVTWELEYPHACVQELLKRLGTHLERLVGEPTFDVYEAVQQLAEAEEESLKESLGKTPTEVELKWDWHDKVFDVFLSHKITDAKDVVLTWYNALDSLGYHPFIDRLSLDAVENIPLYVEQSATFAIAVSANLWQSYWCAVELLKAVDLHAEGKLNILLVPVQGELFKPMEEGAPPQAFPTAATMMQNFRKWFPELGAESRQGVEKLYGGGEYTESRLVKHTLMHYKSFERLLIARIGMSIVRRIEYEAFMAAGGASAEEQLSELTMLVAEANSCQEAIGARTRFEMQTKKQRGGIVEHELMVVEHIEEEGREGKEARPRPAAAQAQEASFSSSPRRERSPSLRRSSSASSFAEPSSAPVASRVQLKTYTFNEFKPLVRSLRAMEQREGAAVTKASLILEQWMLMKQSGTDPQELASQLGPLKEAWTLLLSFIQINASLLRSLGHIEWPPAFVRLLNLLDVFLLSGLNGNFLSKAVGNRVNYANTTIWFCVGFLIFIGAVPLIRRLVVRVRRPARARCESFYDTCIKINVIMAFIFYPVLSSRLLRLYLSRTINGTKLLEDDPRLLYDSITPWRTAGACFLGLYTVGIPLYFFSRLWVSARPASEHHFSARHTRRYGVLFHKYEPGAWWWEMVELVRKLLLTGVLTFIAPGTLAQIFFGIVLSLLALVLLALFTPFVDPRLDAVSVTCQVATVLTLLCAVVLKTPDNGDERTFREAVDVIVIAVQFLPFVTTLFLVVLVCRDVRATYRAHRPRRSTLPAALRDDDPAAVAPEPKWRRLWCFRRRAPPCEDEPAANSDPPKGARRPVKPAPTTAYFDEPSTVARPEKPRQRRRSIVAIRRPAVDAGAAAVDAEQSTQTRTSFHDSSKDGVGADEAAAFCDAKLAASSAPAADLEDVDAKLTL